MIKIIFTIFILLISKRGEVSPRFQILDKANCSYTKDYKFLSKAKLKKMENDLNQTLNSRTIRQFKVDCNKKNSKAFIINDKVRTHHQTLLVWLNESEILGIETLEFNEPKKYEAPNNWFLKIFGKSSQDIYNIDALSGATLTRQSTLKILKQAFFLNKK